MVWTLLCAVMLFVLPSFVSMQPTESGFKRFAYEHMELCPCPGADRLPRGLPEGMTATSMLGFSQPTTPGTRGETDISCCGFCSCSPSCGFKGNCCLIDFQSFLEAAQSTASSR